MKKNNNQERSTSMISHLIVVPSDSRRTGESILQGFSNFLFPDYYKILRCLSLFPHDVSDIYLKEDDYVISKSLGSPLNINFLRADLLEEYLSYVDKKLLVIWSSSKTVKTTSKVILDLSPSLPHISTSKTQNTIHIDELTTAKKHEIVAELLLDAGREDKDLETFRDILESKKYTQKSMSSIEVKLHNCTTPLIDILLNYGLDLKISGIPPSKSITPHISAMVQLSEVIDGLRPPSLLDIPHRKNDAIVHCPAIYTFLYNIDGQTWKKLTKKINQSRRDFLENSIIKNKGYGNSTSPRRSKLFNPYHDKRIAPILREKQEELLLYTATIAVVASNQFIPAFRLPNSAMLNHDLLREIGKILQPNNPDWRSQLNLKMSKYCKRLEAEIPKELTSKIFKNREKILAACDLPIEWLPIGQLPAMYRFELSRVPVTPGNVMNQVLLSQPQIILPYSSLTDILIIRSFDKDDPLRNHIDEIITIGKLSQKTKGLNITIVDIESKDDLIKSLNSFKGAMVIFDCHGGHGGEKQPAWLNIGGKNLDLWHLYREARIPRIVVLAACSTHPIDGSHGSVANGFLESGAYSVLGTFAPIDSRHSSIFILRLLHRISVYMPIILKLRHITWREVITGLLRMSYVRDVLDDLLRQKILTQSKYEEIHIIANELINLREDKQWFEKFRKIIQLELEASDEYLRKLWDERFSFVESMLFVQLGRPENLTITQ
ncbi:hypothetical protein PALA11_04433 [Pseudomonas aeruginosa]|nr:hypothetical protein PALA11_04433 [Pseudomonas aeruginosa]